MPPDVLSSLTPGPDGTPVPPGLHVLRLGNEPKLANLSPEAVRRVSRGEAIPAFFELSSEDKRQSVPRLSVWVESLTTVAQAWVLVGANPVRRWVLFLDADRVRTVSAPTVDGAPATPPLDVQWERATVPDAAGGRVPDSRPGWEGHAGIANVEAGSKTQRAAERMQLADLATVRVLSPADLAAFVAG